ncbi:MAG: 1-hydroxycarotenoid 3,4-desaturase CrtD [Burkholderiaceae bacterium]
MASPVSGHRVVVIGAGVAGLVSALQLARRGLQVTLLEAAPQPGGKMRQLMVDGGAIDSGPTVFTMRWVFEQVYGSVGASLDDELQLTALPVLARHAWDADQRMDLFADPAQSRDAIARLAGPAEGTRFMRFCQQARQVYDTLEGPFIRSQSPTLRSMMGDLGLRGLAVLASLGPMSNLWDALCEHFHDERLRQLFARYATYCGSSPWRAPATLMLVTQVELDGVWSVQGGMHALAQSLAKLGERLGVTARYGCRVAEIGMANGRVDHVRLENGEQLAADSIVFNGDISALGQGLLGQAVKRVASPTSGSKRSLSALTWSVHAETQGFELDRHNVFFQPNYRNEFSDIFNRGKLPATPTVYVCAQDRGIHHQPVERDRMLVLVNAPAIARRNLTESEIDACETHSFSLLARYGLNIHRTAQNTVRTTPGDFERIFPASAGALYGMATHGWMSAFARHGATSKIPGLYLAGGSVHPGPGVPMAAMSGLLAAATLMDHLDSTSHSRRVHISGGTSMPSATTAVTR